MSPSTTMAEREAMRALAEAARATKDIAKTLERMVNEATAMRRAIEQVNETLRNGPDPAAMEHLERQTDPLDGPYEAPRTDDAQ